jgi:iron complex transport system permease protein
MPSHSCCPHSSSVPFSPWHPPAASTSSLGADTAAGLGHDVGRSRVLGIVATVLLCGGATAIAGPIVFLGLLVPHALRAVVGGSYGRLLPLGCSRRVFLLLADVVGRVVAPPGEVQAGIVVAIIGAPS